MIKSIRFICLIIIVSLIFAGCRTGNTDDNPPVTHPNTFKHELEDGNWKAGRDMARGFWTTTSTHEECRWTLWGKGRRDLLNNGGQGLHKFVVNVKEDDELETLHCGNWRPS